MSSASFATELEIQNHIAFRSKNIKLDENIKYSRLFDFYNSLKSLQMFIVNFLFMTAIY